MLASEQYSCPNEKRNFSAEFKRESAQLVVDQNYAVAEVAKAMDIRKAIYTTNAIESLNNVPHVVIKKLKVFPTDDSIRTVVYLAIKDASKNGVCLSRTDGWQ
ncbi:hypothetical protein DMB84_010820 [Pectobacterium aquaticum]|uniref:Transposase n=1 Tax=Pectobacterium aquaticum TaxID=2204145 RepID=A0AA93DMP4_9GAMM|nr:hypothetical protein [Pectobacterium carotovorum subsp. carotovorum]RRO19844.1 hypothetical protein DMB84_010820 [Pectobacterium aquaticum]